MNQNEVDSFTPSVSYAEVVGAGSSDLNFLAENHL